jgi:RNA polymerase sigma-70 factor (ECF subfamily)
MKGACDEALMARYAEGEEGAFNELFRRFERRAYIYFRRRTGSEARAWDLYQELFLRLHRFRHTYDPSQTFAPWFFQVANRVFIDDCRRSFRSREVALTESPAPARDADAENRAGEVELLDLLLGTLSMEQAQVVLAAKVQGMGYAEIASKLGKSVDCVKQVGSRALRALRADRCLVNSALNRGDQ